MIILINAREVVAFKLVKSKTKQIKVSVTDNQKILNNV